MGSLLTITGYVMIGYAVCKTILKSLKNIKGAIQNER